MFFSTWDVFWTFFFCLFLILPMTHSEAILSLLFVCTALKIMFLRLLARQLRPPHLNPVRMWRQLAAAAAAAAKSSTPAAAEPPTTRGHYFRRSSWAVRRAGRFIWAAALSTTTPPYRQAKIADPVTAWLGSGPFWCASGSFWGGPFLGASGIFWCA